LISGDPGSGARPATFREVFAGTEFRAIYAASTLSWVGDYVARAAVTALVYQITNSVAASAAAFAISYAPWLLGGSVLVALAERYPYRSVMVVCDLGRMMIMAMVAIPGIPLPGVLALLFACALLAPPFDAARSATLPAVLAGDRYVVGVAALGTIAQPAQVAGYLLGAALAAHQPRAALLINAGTFAVSALVVRLGVRQRLPALGAERRSDLLHETADGFRLVFRTPTLRALVMIVYGASLFAVLPEGLGAVWAAQVANPASRGLAQGMIMAGAPLGYILGALTVSRLVPPDLRKRLIRPLAVATPVLLIPCLADPPAGVVALLACGCGFALGGLVPVANGLFVQALPAEYRARAFGVVQGGLHLLQGAAVLVAGALAQLYRLPLVVGAWCVGGLCLMAGLSLALPPALARSSRGVTGTARTASRTPLPGTMEP